MLKPIFTPSPPPSASRSGGRTAAAKRVHSKPHDYRDGEPRVKRAVRIGCDRAHAIGYMQGLLRRMTITGPQADINLGIQNLCQWRLDLAGADRHDPGRNRHHRLRRHRQPGGHQHVNSHRHHRAGDRSRDARAASITSRRKHIGNDNGPVVSTLLRKVQSS